MKICNNCKINKEDECFYLIKNGSKLHSNCKVCCSIKNKENQINRNKEQKNTYNKIYYSKNKNQISLQNREYKNTYSREYYQLNKNMIFEKEKERYNNDIQFRLSKIYRNRLNNYLKDELTSMKYLYCTISELKKFIEIQFDIHMNWENRSKLWELDHVIPISKFNLQLTEHKNICFHWCNLKPISTIQNRKKSNKIIENIIKEHQNFSFYYSLRNNLTYINIYDFYKNNLII
jgi:hypothetical protein